MASGPNVHGSMEKFLQDQIMRITLLERRLAIVGSAEAVPPRLSPSGELITDCNDARAVGFYRGAQLLNAPLATGAGSLIVSRGAAAGNNIRQDFTNIATVGGQPDIRRWTRVSYDGGATWRTWARSDINAMIAVGVVEGANYNVEHGRYDLAVGSKRWAFNGVFTTQYRAYRILYQYYTADANGNALNLRSGGTDILSAGNYIYGLVYMTGGSGNAVQYLSTNNRFGLAGSSASGHHGEVTITEPMFTAGVANQKRARWFDSGYAPAQTTHGGGALSGFDATAMDGFTLELSNLTTNGIDPGSAAWISVEGIA